MTFALFYAYRCNAELIMQLFKDGRPSRCVSKAIVYDELNLNRPGHRWAGQRVTRAACNRPRLSFPIQMCLLRKTNEKSLTLQPVCNVKDSVGFCLIRDGKLRFEDSYLCAFANISQSESLLCHVASVMRYLGLGFKHGSVIW